MCSVAVVFSSQWIIAGVLAFLRLQRGVEVGFDFREVAA
jgi:hypothetical protein